MMPEADYSISKYENIPIHSVVGINIGVRKFILFCCIFHNFVIFLDYILIVILCLFFSDVVILNRVKI